MELWDWFKLAFAVGMGWHTSFTVYAFGVDVGNYCISHVRKMYHRYKQQRMCDEILEVKDGHEVS